VRLDTTSLLGLPLKLVICWTSGLLDPFEVELCYGGSMYMWLPVERTC
jgi:hypothetical protein